MSEPVCPLCHGEGRIEVSWTVTESSIIATSETYCPCDIGRGLWRYDQDARAEWKEAEQIEQMKARARSIDWHARFREEHR